MKSAVLFVLCATVLQAAGAHDDLSAQELKFGADRSESTHQGVIAAK
jgi:hypothetical protein